MGCHPARIENWTIVSRTGSKNRPVFEVQRQVCEIIPGRFKMMNRLGAVPSRRDDNFPNVFQHDSPLFPEQCGGPITDLQGNVLGINISRKGRAACYAIPSDHLKMVLDELMVKTVASH